MKIKTNLGYINNAASIALVREMDTPMIPVAIRERAAKERLTVVAGFIVEDKLPGIKMLDDARQERKRAIENYHICRDEMKERLNRSCIEPLAILPKTAWEHICNASGLFRFEPDNSGQVKVSTALLKKFESRAENTLICTVLVGALALGFRAFLVSDSWFEALAITGFEVVALFFTCGLVFVHGKKGVAGYELRLWVQKLSVAVQARIFASQPREQVLREFFPNSAQMYFPNSINDSWREVRLILPKPPADVEAILLKARDLKLKVAAVADAVAFAESPSEILWRSYDNIAARKLEEWQRREYEKQIRAETDPIVYYEHGSAVAIIAQFGDFPVEHDVVNNVVNSEYLI